MEEKKKQKVYIGIIIFCIVATGLFLYFMRSGSTASNAASHPSDFSDVPVHNVATTTPNGTAVGGVDVSLVRFAPPAVFPVTNNYKNDVLDKSKVQSLNDYTPVTVTPADQSRDNPFAGY